MMGGVPHFFFVSNTCFATCPQASLVMRPPSLACPVISTAKAVKAVPPLVLRVLPPFLGTY